MNAHLGLLFLAATTLVWTVASSVATDAVAAGTVTSAAAAAAAAAQAAAQAAAGGNGHGLGSSQQQQMQQLQQSSAGASTANTNPNSNSTITHHTELSADGGRLNHLVVDRNTGRVFVGAINNLYQLSPDLELVATARTGPQNDSTDCTVLECPQNTKREPTDNVNKVGGTDRAIERSLVL